MPFLMKKLDEIYFNYVVNGLCISIFGLFITNTLLILDQNYQTKFVFIVSLSFVLFFGYKYHREKKSRLKTLKFLQTFMDLDFKHEKVIYLKREL